MKYYHFLYKICKKYALFSICSKKKQTKCKKIDRISSIKATK